ncbi:hypothetical protein BC939DRAFT_456619 [Gamsiella multidivaricata]|uniref:uncharacterized protein n=1 Tax=Gamsiella multidivaricata TaxID=101098 RepID=UPI00221EC4E5|nr:uncharacterized protein BC939DRAFT_456619 [Gamsiella multidivaricata]KAI7820938.1 hypothetical protein BC939DRAFT_456619 [Gamsiella multidivaricata]
MERERDMANTADILKSSRCCTIALETEREREREREWSVGGGAGGLERTIETVVGVEGPPVRLHFGFGGLIRPRTRSWCQPSVWTSASLLRGFPESETGETREGFLRDGPLPPYLLPCRPPWQQKEVTNRQSDRLADYRHGMAKWCCQLTAGLTSTGPARKNASPVWAGLHMCFCSADDKD